MQKDLDEISRWVNKNGMELNIDKCKYLRFGKGKEMGDYTMDGIQLEEVEKYK